MPRPRLTKEHIKEAVKLRKAGALDKDIASYIGVRPDTFSKWINHPRTPNQTQLAQALKKAESEYRTNLLTIIYNEAANKTWQAAAWLLERKYPDEFARKDRSSISAKIESVPTFIFDRSDA